MKEKLYNKYINIVLIFYFLSSVNIIFYKYSKLINIIYILISIFIFIRILKKKIYVDKKIVFFWIFFCITIFLSLIISKYRVSIFISTIQFILFNITSIFICMKFPGDSTNKILNFYVKYAILLCIFSISIKLLSSNNMVYYMGFKANKISIMGINIFQIVNGLNNDLGYSSFTNNPNVFGFIVAIGFNIYNSQYYKKINNNIFIKILLNLLFLYGLILSNSRGAYIVCLIMFYIQKIGKLYFMKKSKFKFYIVNLIILIFLVVIGIYNNSYILNLISNLKSGTGRYEIWGYLLSFFKSNVIFGAGYGSISNNILSNNWALSSNELITYSAFNTYLSILVELGIIGIALFLIWIFYILKFLIKNIKNSYNDNNKELFYKEILVLSLFISTYVIIIVENKIMNSTYYNIIWNILSIEVLKRNRRSL